MAENENKEAKAVDVNPAASEVKEEEEVDLGTVRIADDVVAMIAGYTAKDVDGVADMAGSSTSAFLRSAGYKRPVKGVRVEVNEGNVRVDLAVIMEYGYNIPATSSRIQARVKQSIENMTGLTVQDVNVRIAGIHMPGQEQ